MNEIERRAVAAANRVARRGSRPISIRRFWVCKCHFKTIARKPQTCERCGGAMKPGRII